MVKHNNEKNFPIAQTITRKFNTLKKFKLVRMKNIEKRMLLINFAWIVMNTFA